MLITTRIDISRGLALTDLLLKKIPYATNNALTRTAKELVTVEREELKTEFQIRKPFLLGRVRIVKYSRPNDLWTRVAIDSDVQGGKLLLALFEAGAEKLPELGSEIAVPPTGGAVRPSMAEPMSSRLLYKKLALKPSTTSSGKLQYKGLQRTFIIAGVGVFQRTSSRQRGARAKKGVAEGKGKDKDVVLLYSFKHGVPLRARMHFVRTAREMVAKRFGEIWSDEFARELSGRRLR